jgi:hypothetical protein
MLLRYIWRVSVATAETSLHKERFVRPNIDRDMGQLHHRRGAVKPVPFWCALLDARCLDAGESVLRCATSRPCYVSTTDLLARKC